MHFNELDDFTNKKIISVISNMKNNNIKKYSLYKSLDDISLLNLSFRHGDFLHSQWTDYEENLILPILVSNGYKKVCTIACSKKYNLNNIIIPNNCDSLIIKNKWNMWVLIIYLKNSFLYNELEELVNETNSFSKRGYMLGYGDATIKD
jgi:hypothetical protein